MPQCFVLSSFYVRYWSILSREGVIRSNVDGWLQHLKDTAKQKARGKIQKERNRVILLYHHLRKKKKIRNRRNQAFKDKMRLNVAASIVPGNEMD